MSFVRSPSTYNDGLWHQAAAVYNGTNTITLFMDGLAVGTLAVTQVILPPSGYLRAGYMDLTRFYTIFAQNYDGAPETMSFFWQGSIDEASMHNAAFTAEQVAALYASGSAHGAPLPPEQPDPGPPPPPPPPSTYPSKVLADAPSLYWRLNELSQTTIADASGHNRTGTYRNGLSYGVAGALIDDSTAVVSPGTSAVAYSNQLQAAPTTYSLEAWIKTSSSEGGKILGYEDVQTGWGDNYDRQLYMLNDGRIAYGIVAGAAQQTVTSVATYNDDQWHHVVATQGASGMNLYVDRIPVGANGSAVTPDAYSGYWRLGGGNLTGWPNAPAASALAGEYDEVAVYPVELTPTQVSAHSDPLPVAPDAPSNLHTTSVGATSVGLAWDVPAGTVTGYQVYRDAVLVGSPTAAAFTDTTVNGHQSYSYTVTALNDTLESDPSSALVVGTPNQLPTLSALPSTVTVTEGQSGVVNLTTGDPDGDVVTTSIASGPGFASIVGSELQLAPTTGDATGSPYTVTVEATDGIDTVSVDVTVNVEIPPVAPDAPSNLHTTSVGATSVGLAWDAPAGTVTGYQVYRDAVLVGSPTAAAFTDTTVNGHQSYSYTVTALNDTLESDPSSALVVGTPNQLPTLSALPSTVTVIEGESGVVNLTTGDPDGDVVTTSIASGPGFASIVGSELQLAPVTGDATGSPYTVTVEATDGIDTVSLDVTVNVNVPGDPPAGSVVGDFDGDGATDIAVFRPSNGRWYIQGSAGSVEWGKPGDLPASGDFNGDGATDIAVFRPSNGRWYIQGVAGSTVFGKSGDVPVPGDFDGDGATDIAVFRPSNGRWYIQGVAGSTVFGKSGDVPVPGDFDGDGATDIAVFRPSNGRWYIQGVAGSTVFGKSGDVPVPGDFDGDGATDIAVFRPSNGRWYIQGVAGSTVFGKSGDVPVPGDFDGDGATDIAVFRPSNGRWYIQGVAGSTEWGQTGDVPVPRPTGSL